MKKVSRAYKQAMNKHLRDHSYMIVSVGVISNEAQANAYVSSTSHYLSNNKALFKDGAVVNTYATYEQNVFKADGSMIFAPEQTGYEQLASGVGYLSSEVKGGITVSFDKAYDIKGLTINFGEYYPKKFTIETSNGISKTYNNNKSVWTTEDNFDNTLSITVTPTTFVNGNSKRLRIESMLMGIGITFQNDDIESASFTESASFISEELPQIDFSITCFDKYQRFRVDDSNSFINYLEAGQEIVASLGIELEDGSTEFVTLPLTYLSSWSSNNDKVAFTSVDRFAFLTGKYTGGNTIHSRTLYDDAIAVLTDAGLEPDEYEVSDLLRSINVVNPLPEVSYAECLQLIANAGRCLLKQNDLGMVTLTPNFENILEPEEITIETDSQAAWSIPDNIKVGANTVYADYTEDFFKADGSQLFLPTDMSLVSDTGFVSKRLSDANGVFPEQDISEDIIPVDYTWYSPSSSVFIIQPDNSVMVHYTASMLSSKFRFLVDFPLTKGTYYIEGFLSPNVEHIGTFRFTFRNIEDASISSRDIIARNFPYEFEVYNDTVCTLSFVTTSSNYSWVGDYYVKPVLTKIENYEKPKLKVKLPVPYTYHNIGLVFYNPMKNFVLRTFSEGEPVDEVEVLSEEGETIFNVDHSFFSFDEIEIEFLATTNPRQRVVLQQFQFGKLSEYELKKESMLENPIGTVEPKTQSVSVRVFTFQEGQSGEQPQALDDNVFSTFVVNPTGESVTFENQLISTRAHALSVAKWIANYFANNVTYEVRYRGEPRIESADYIFLESDVVDTLQVEVESHTIEFDGALSGTLNMRRAANLVSG